MTSGNKDDKLLEDTRIQLASAQTKLKQDNSILNNFTKQTGLRKDNNRLVIANLKKTLNDDERYAINTYISSESYKINEVLRGKIKPTKQQEKIIDNLDRALNKCDNYKGNVVRVLEIKDKQKLDAFLNHNKVGEITEYNEYLSFSDNLNEAII